MKAVVLHEYGGPEKLQFEDVPDPVAGPGEVLVRTAASSVNPIDFKIRNGAMKEMFPTEFPAILGVDVSGTVQAVGEGVTGFEPGDRVFAMTSKTYAELVVVKASDLALVPEDLDLVSAAALPLVTTTGEQLITVGIKPEKGWTVLIAGATGGVGRSAVYTAKQLGVTVIAGVRKKQLEQAAALGADQVVALDDSDAMAKLGFVHAVGDAVGGKTAEQLLEKVQPNGVFATVLYPPANAGLNPTVRVERVGAVPNAHTLRTLAEAVAAGKLVIPIDRMVPLSEAAEAQSAAEKGGLAKILLLA